MWTQDLHLAAVTSFAPAVLQIYHRDVKSNNVLLSEDFQSAKICDVGLARIMGGTSLSSSSHLVHATFAYAAPEILLNKR